MKQSAISVQQSAIEYDDNDGTLWVVVDGKRYMLSQTSGELVASEGHGISDLYWSNVPESAEQVRDTFRSIATLRTEIAALRDEPEKLRRNFAEYLAHKYIKQPSYIAELCDESLDKTGALLGYVREAARLLSADAAAEREATPEITSGAGDE